MPGLINLFQQKRQRTIEAKREYGSFGRHFGQALGIAGQLPKRLERGVGTINMCIVHFENWHVDFY